MPEAHALAPATERKEQGESLQQEDGANGKGSDTHEPPTHKPPRHQARGDAAPRQGGDTGLQETFAGVDAIATEMAGPAVTSDTPREKERQRASERNRETDRDRQTEGDRWRGRTVSDTSTYMSGSASTTSATPEPRSPFSAAVIADAASRRIAAFGTRGISTTVAGGKGRGREPAGAAGAGAGRTQYEDLVLVGAPRARDREQLAVESSEISSGRVSAIWTSSADARIHLGQVVTSHVDGSEAASSDALVRRVL